MKHKIAALAVSAVAGFIILGGQANAAETGKNNSRTLCPPYCDGMPSGPRDSGGPDVRPRDGDGGHVRPRHDGGGDRHRHHRNWRRHYGGSVFIESYPRYYPRYSIYDQYDGPDFYDDPGYDDGYVYDDRPIIRRGISCGRAASGLRAAGYRSIVTIECRGSSYTFKALKAGKRYKLTVSARSGKILNRVRG